MEQIAAAKIKIYEFPEVMLLHLLRDKSLLASSPEVSPYTIVFFCFVSPGCLSGGGWRRGGKEGEQADEGKILPENSFSLKVEKLAQRHFYSSQFSRAF